MKKAIVLLLIVAILLLSSLAIAQATAYASQPEPEPTPTLGPPWSLDIYLPVVVSRGTIVGPPPVP